jgi:hypothetical protein
MPSLSAKVFRFSVFPLVTHLDVLLLYPFICQTSYYYSFALSLSLVMELH